MDSVVQDAYQFYLDPSFSDLDFANLPNFSQVLPEPFHLDNEPPAKRKTRLRAAKACLACRSRHMKCDSVEPKCTRCQLDEKTCVYTKSRRGGSHKVSSPTQDNAKRAFPGTSTASSGRTPGMDTDQGSLESMNSMPTIDSFVFCDLLDDATSERQGHDLIGSFYEYFHPAHSFCLPRAYLFSRRENNPRSLEHLIPVMEYIGSVYSGNNDSDQYKPVADQVLNFENLPATGFSVQALILFALARHCSDEYDIADVCINKAIDIALSIGMDSREFATLDGDGDVVLAESWRRTWWMLYVSDATFAAVGHRATHRLGNIKFRVALPCEDWDYESGKIPCPRTFEEYDSRELNDEEVVFSSMSYLIDAVRIASSTCSTRVAPFCPGNRAILAADAKFVNWLLYLPRCKQEAVKEDGTIDETMFLAHVCINVEKMLLHRPHSVLAFSEIETRSKCTPPADSRPPPDMQRSILLHTAKALEATSAAIMLFALPAPMIKHSPTVTCALALAIMAQVSGCNYISNFCDRKKPDDLEKAKCRAEAYEIGRDRVRLGLGALKAAMHLWPLARRSVREVVGVSRELLTGNTGECATRTDNSKDSTSESLG